MGKVEIFQSWYRKHPIGIYLFSALIPINPRFYTLGIILLIIDLIIRKFLLHQSPVTHKKLSSGINYGLVLFFLLHVTGAIYSENTAFASMDIGMKVSFLIFPFIFLIYPLRVNWFRLSKAFILGAIISIVLSVGHATYIYMNEGFYSNFFDSRLSFMMHRSYWATYIAIAYSLSWYLYLKKELSTGSAASLLLLFSAMIFMSGSKMGILILLIITISWITFFITTKKKYKLGLVSLGLFLGVGWTIYNYAPQLNTRINNGIESVFGGKKIAPTSTESNAARILVWSSALDEIKENALFGVGTGDIKDQLKARNIKNGYTGVAEMNMNAHNQFLNTQLALGVLGLLALLFSFIQPFIRANKEHQFALRTIVVILFLSLLTESFFETQAGIIPGAFLLSLIGSYQKSEVD